MRVAVLGAAVLLAVVVLLGRAPVPEHVDVPPPTKMSSMRTASTTTTIVPAQTAGAAPTSTTLAAAPLKTSEDARRFLEEQGIDPDRVAEETAEQYRRRSQPPIR